MTERLADASTAPGARGVGPCPADDDLAAFVDGSLAGDARAAVERHLDGCAACRAAVGHAVAVDGAAPAGGDTVGRYRLERAIGAGGMGVVWTAWDPELERRVAIKLLGAAGDGDAARARLVREARALARLQHPNVVAVHDVGEAGGEVFIATELVDGEPMSAWQRGRPWREIAEAYLQAARGLAAAHDAGLVHRDVKPDNLLVGADGRVRVGDFGLAWTAAGIVTAGDGGEGEDEDAHDGAHDGAHEHERSRLTADGHVVGTPAYMAPEQRAGDPPDPRSDQYSLCLALAEALTGTRPGPDAGADRLHAAAPAVPRAVAAVVARGLAAAPAARFADLHALAAALAAALAPPARRGPRLAAAALAAVPLAAAVAVVLSVAGSGTPAPRPPRPPVAGPAGPPADRADPAATPLAAAQAALARGDGAACLAALADAPAGRDRDLVAAECQLQAGRCDDGLAALRAAGQPAQAAALLADAYCPPDQGDVATRLRRLVRQVNGLARQRRLGCDGYARAALALAGSPELDRVPDARTSLVPTFADLATCDRHATGCAPARALLARARALGVAVPPDPACEPGP